MHGDFGESWRQGRPALSAVLERLPATFSLTTLASSLAVASGMTLGIGAAARPRSLWDVLARLTALLGQAVPAFWLGTMLILFFAVDLRLGRSSGLSGPVGFALPALSLAAFPRRR